MRTESRRALLGGVGLFLGCVALLATTGCGAAEPEGEEPLALTRQPVITWQNLTLGTGWSAANGSTPAVAIVNNNILTFRGAIKGTSTASSTPFLLPTGYRPGNGADSFKLRVTMSGNAGGVLFVHADTAQSPPLYQTTLVQDGLDGPGNEARAMTSLDGLTIDMSTAGYDSLRNAVAPYGWSFIYSFRDQGAEDFVTVTNNTGFVRFQGAIYRSSYSSDLHLFDLPSNYAPAADVFLPIAIQNCSAGGQTKYGELHIYGGGAVYAQGENLDYTDPNCGIYLEGTAFSRSLTTTSLSLAGSWAPYSSRAVKVRNDNGIIRLEGAVWNGTGTQVATLPNGWAPLRTTYIVADMFQASHGRVIIDTAGKISVDQSNLSLASALLSLDGVSFAR